MRPRPQQYTNLRSGQEGRDAVAWYWRLVALASSIIILGGFLILPVTFDRRDDLRASPTALGVFAVALLTAGFVLTGLLCFAVRVPIFQVESVFTPSLVSCLIGLLTVFWDFLVYRDYHWNTLALLVTIAGGISSVVYGFLVLYTYRRIHLAKTGQNNGTVPLSDVRGNGTEDTLWHPRVFYDNYNANMFPASAHQAPSPTVYNHNAITEEEMQRQQMLMLLLQKEQPGAPGLAPGTFRIEWQSPGDEDITPVNGYYAPDQHSEYNTSHPGPSPGILRRMTSGLQPWDGVWRTSVAAAAAAQPTAPAPSRHHRDVSWREERRREIEAGSMEYR